MHINSFIHYLQTEKRYSENILLAYQNDLDAFARYLKESYDLTAIERVNHTMIRSWVVQLASTPISSRSINRKVSTLKTYFRYLRKNSLISHNPMLKILAPKMRKSLPEFVSEDNMDKLFDCFPNDFSFEAQRDRLIIEVLYLTGVRANELVNLKIIDVDTMQMQIKVLGKRNKERLIPFGRYLQKSFEKYLVVREKELEIVDSEFLFLTSKGKKIYKKLVYNVVNSYLSTVSTLKKKSPHILRHTFATHMLNNGADLNSIKELLGHANLSATQVYTHNTIEKLKSIYNQAHPRA